MSRPPRPGTLSRAWLIALICYPILCLITGFMAVVWPWIGTLLLLVCLAGQSAVDPTDDVPLASAALVQLVLAFACWYSASPSPVPRSLVGPICFASIVFPIAVGVFAAIRSSQHRPRG